MKNLTYEENYNKLKNQILFDTPESKLTPVIYNKGDFIVHEGDQLESMIFILSGKVKIYQNYENGKTLLLQIMEGLTFIGDIEYFLERPAECSVEALNTVKAIKLNFSYIHKKLRHNILFLDHMLIQISRKILDTNKYASLNLMYPLDTRLASYILSIKDDLFDTGKLTSITDVANQLGTSYRHLERRLKKLEDGSIIERNNKTIKILNNEKLIEIGRGNIYERNNESFVKG
ncbi:MAG: Crp/Fnr family transcriptional regulator [Tenericutes bacterium]|nr:Crp/Fnr family transcriptional regulator [Mycoplasmatota bacterium]